MAPLWAAFVLLSALEETHALSQRASKELFVITLALAGAWLAYAARWYRGHYGLVTRREEPTTSQALSIFATNEPLKGTVRWWWFGVGTLVCALYLADLFHPPFAQWFNGIGLVGLTIFLLPIACMTGGVSRWVRGRHLLARVGIVIIIVFHAAYLIGLLDKWQDLRGTAMVLLLASLNDHWLLARMLSGRFAEAHDA